MYYAPAPITTSENDVECTLKCHKIPGYKINLPITAAISEYPIKTKIRSKFSDRPTKSVTLTELVTTCYQKRQVKRCDTERPSVCSVFVATC